MTRHLTFTPAPPQGRDNYGQWIAAGNGRLPAEALSTRDREDLIYDLWAQRWSDQQIAEHTKETVHTIRRIRDRLGLTANRTE